MCRGVILMSELGLPLKLGCRHHMFLLSYRGFAFIEFVTKQEAKNAMDSIAGAHLYGRRLVVEWAEQGDEGLDEIRAKTAAKFRGEAVDEFDEMPAKRRKATM